MSKQSYFLFCGIIKSELFGLIGEEAMKYRALASYLEEAFGEKLYKLSFDGGFTCPNRDGTVGRNGCIFCLDGSGDFAIPVGEDLDRAVEYAKALVSKKKHSERYIAYFQSYSGTYGKLERLRSLYSAVVSRSDIAVLDIATRPDCLGDDVIELLSELNKVKPVWVELGLQTIHPATAEYIRRGYALPVYDSAVKRLKAAGIYVIVHMIIGLPGETPQMAAETAEYIGRSGADGIKLQLLHVLRGTELADDYLAGRFEVLSLEEYCEAVRLCLEALPAGITIHRLTGDGSKRDLIAPLWSADKKRVLSALNRALEE